MLLHFFNLPDLAVYVVLGVLILHSLPSLGNRILGFLRNLDDFRANRP